MAPKVHKEDGKAAKEERDKGSKRGLEEEEVEVTKKSKAALEVRRGRSTLH